MKKTKIFLLILLVVIQAVHARTYTLFSQYSVRDGLSELNVMSMLQDHKGQMWFGTFDGLNSFDGYSFKTYKTNPGQVYGLDNYRVDKIVEDARGYLWVQTYDGRIYRFDPRTEIFLPVPQCKDEYKNYRMKLEKIKCFPDGSVWLTGGQDGCFRIEYGRDDDTPVVSHFSETNESLSSNIVNTIFQDKSKTTWVLTQNGLNIFKHGSLKPIQLFKEKTGGALFSIDESAKKIWIGGEHGKVRIYNKRTATFDGIPSVCESSVISIKTINSSQMFFLSDQSGFYVYDLLTQRFKAFCNNPEAGAASDRFYSCYMDRDKNIWIETDKPAVVLFQPKTGVVTNFQVKVAASSQFSPLPNFFVVEDKFNNIWVHPRYGGFGMYNKQTNQLDAFYSAPDDPQRKFSNMMHSVYSDHQGNLWLCPFSHGIEKVVFFDSPFNFIKPRPAETTSAGNEIRSICEDSRGNVWVGAKNGIVSVFDKNKHKLGELGVNGVVGNSQPLKALVYTIYEDRLKRIWLGAKGTGLYRLDPVGDGLKYKITNMQYNPYDIYSVSSNNIYSIKEDRRGHLWIATYGGGVNLLQEINGESRFISPRNKLKNYPIDQCNRARYITQDKWGRMYIGTTQGMLVFEMKNSNPEEIYFELVKHQPENLTTISGNDVHYILPTRDGKLYLAIFGGGIDVLEQPYQLHKKNNFKSYTVRNAAMPSNVVYTLHEDPKGNVWFSTQTLIGKFVPATQSFDTYSPLNDVSYSLIEASVCGMRNGGLLYGTTEGLVDFNPARPLKSSFVPRIVLTGLHVFNENVEVGVAESPLKVSIDDTKELELNHHQNMLTITFAALDYTAPTNIQYAYMLEGFDKEWNYVHNQRMANYTNLPAGKYVFRVKSTNAEGVWVDNERKLVIIRQPSFWESWMGFVFYLFVFIGLVVLVAYVLFSFMKLKSNVEIEQRITNLKLRFFTDISHELRTPLTLISSPIESVLKNEVLTERGHEQMVLVQRNTERMVRLINQILDFRKIQNKKMKLLVEQIQPGEFMRNICNNFTRLAEEKKINFSFIDESNHELIWADKDKFEKIFYNLLSNAFKFTPAGKSIEVHIVSDAEFVNVTVSDQGAGMNKDRLKLLFRRFESIANEGAVTQGTGIGLSLTKELVEMHHARIEVDSEDGKGSVFKVIFLKGNAHFADDDDLIHADHPVAELSGELVCDATDEPHEMDLTHDEEHETHRKSILIVEDNDEMRAFLRSVLCVKFDVVEAENGKVGLAKALSHCPDLIITDIMMPEMNGMELARAIKNDINISHIPIVLLTAKTDMENKLEALQYGVDDYITKPFSSAYLEARIENLLKLRSQLQELYRSSLTSGVISPSKPNVVSQDDVFIQRIMAFIEVNIENTELTIDDIAKHVGFSRSALFKKLKSLTGLAPVEFLKEVRIQRAAQLIESGEYYFNEITYMVGISDPRYFSRCFKQKFGVSPREYKEKCAEKGH